MNKKFLMGGPSICFSAHLCRGVVNWVPLSGDLKPLPLAYVACKKGSRVCNTIGVEKLTKGKASNLGG